MSEAVSIVICINHRYKLNNPSCAARGAEQIAAALEQQLNQACLNILVQRIDCMGQCERGPNLRIAPGGRFYHGVTMEDLPDIIAELQHLAELS